MRTLAIVAALPALLLVSACGVGGPSIPPAPQTVAPTVNKLPPVEPPTTERVAPLVREQARNLQQAKQANNELQKTLVKTKAVNLNLESLLNSSIEEGQANKQKLEQIQDLVGQEREHNKELARLANEQSDTIATMEQRADELQVEVVSLTAKIAVANQQASNASSQLDLANNRIAQLTELKDRAVQNANRWKGEVDVEKGKTETERVWKWRFFWWAAIGSAAGLLYILARLHPATRGFIP